MARIDLNIVDRGTKGSEWVAENEALTPEHLDDVIEQRTDNSGALNSLPTPFARFFVAREAFRRVTEEYLNPQNTLKQAGFAYKQLVSDILDVYELLFNIKYHKNQWRNGEKIELREWDAASDMEYVKGKMPTFYNAIKDYYNTDIAQDKLYFLVYTENGKDYLLACSSPITGFITPPDMDKSQITENNVPEIKFNGSQYKDLHIRRKSKGEYFSKEKRFEERNEDFKNYMYALFGDGNIASTFQTIKDYIQGFGKDKDIRNDFKQKMEVIRTDNNNDLIINGLRISSLNEEDILSYFRDSIIRTPFRISSKKFKTISYSKDEENRDYDFLMPFKPEVYNLFDGNEPDADIQIKRSNRVEVTLRYNGKSYSKNYVEECPSPSEGKIHNLEKESINFDLGIFPNILSHKANENNYFKVMVVGADEDPEPPYFSINKTNLSFWKKEDNGIKCVKEVAPNDNAKYGLRPSVVRSEFKSNTMESGTKFYELFNTDFKLIEVEILGNKGLVEPVWEKSYPSSETFTYAVDLGTSNTFMSRCRNRENGEPDLTTKPELFKMQRTMVSYLHEISTDDQYSLSKQVEDSIFEKAKNRIKTEFLPAIIDNEYYKFPIRTAICGTKKKVEIPRLFDNHNIAFFYEKMMANDDQKIYTDIKWDESDNNERILRLFVRELLLIIKCDVLQRNGDLDRTRLVWFSPLSFTSQEKKMYKSIWSEEPKNILDINEDNIQNYSESEAPYYYYLKSNYISDSDAVTVIDIGGGSTDFVYFKDNKPIIANSIHFGCDVLWGNGYNEFKTAKDNGIFKCYSKTIRFDGRLELNELNDDMIPEKAPTKTKDIINFWISNDEFCHITKNLSTDFKPLFIYHLTAILFYMADMYKANGREAPRTIIFSGNGSKYIDSFITDDVNVLREMINLVFKEVFGGEHNVNLKLPAERKESTCYGGLYRDRNTERVKSMVYQGDTSYEYKTVSDISEHFADLKIALKPKYDTLSQLYEKILELAIQRSTIDGTSKTDIYIEKAKEDMQIPLTTHYKTQVKDKYNGSMLYNDSVFFIPITQRIFEMTNL